MHLTHTGKFQRNSVGISLTCSSRDLACRNLLLREDQGRLLCKVADFGLSREAEEYTSSSHLLPVRWSSIESLRYRTFSQKSDVWSFGIVLWEIFSFGAEPYMELANNQILDFLTRGERLAKPDNCPDEVYELMCKCWNENSSNRPSFLELGRLLLKMGSPKVKLDEIYTDHSDTTVSASDVSMSIAMPKQPGYSGNARPSVLCAVCCVRCAVCAVRCAVCVVRCALCGVCGVRCALCALCGVCCVRCALCGVCAVCCALCGISDMVGYESRPGYASNAQINR